MLKKPLYFPHMNIPAECPAFGSLLLLSDEISIVAPNLAPVRDHRTLELLEVGLLRRQDPFQVIGREGMSEISGKLKSFRKRRGADSFQRMHIEKFMESQRHSYVHRGKMGYDPFTGGKILNVHWSKGGLSSRDLCEFGDIDDDGFIRMPVDQAMFLLGLLAREISKKEKLPVVGSSQVTEPYGGNVHHQAIQRASVELMPSIDYSSERFSVERLLRAKEMYGADLQYYCSNVARELKARIEFSIEGYPNNPRRGMDFLEREKNELVEVYQNEYIELCNEITHVSRAEVYRTALGIVLPTIISMALVDDPLKSAAFVGLSGLVGALVPNREIPNRLARHKVVYDINRFVDPDLRRRTPRRNR